MDWIPKTASEAASSGRGSARPIVAAAGALLPLHDPERMGALLSTLEPRLSAVALGFTRDPDAAQDVVQNAFEKVLRHGEKFRGQARPSTWIHRIVANEALMWLRTQRRRREVRPEGGNDDFAQLVDAAPTPAEALEREQQIGRLRSRLCDLPDEERDVVRCCALDGQSYSEYGDRTGLHPAAVKSRAFRARRRLATLLRE
jgi:RNA polymerase sigma-70 factor (ECF subfamily)